MKHTPGPWIAENKCTGRPPEAGAAVIASDTEPAISNPSRGIVAYACRLASRTSAETEANARLIAAAPDLFEALRAMVDRWEPDTEGQDRIMWENAREALEKARGAHESSAHQMCPICLAAERDDLIKANALLHALIGNREAEIERLRAALKPFADMATIALRTPGDCAHGTMTVEINRLLFAKGVLEHP